MNNKVSFFRRLGAYLIDYFLVTLVITSLANSHIINKNSDKYLDTYNNYVGMVSEYSALSTTFESDYKDGKIDETEYNYLKEKYPNHIEIIDKYYEDGITKEEYDSIYNDLLKKYDVELKDYAYKLEKYSIVNEILTIVITILYFAVFVYYVDGVSLGKKIFNLKITNKDGKKVSFKNLFVRTIILTNVIMSLINLIAVLTLSKNSFYTISSAASIISIILELAIILTISYRKDGRGLHDLLGNTLVISTKGE